MVLTHNEHGTATGQVCQKEFRTDVSLAMQLSWNSISNNSQLGVMFYVHLYSYLYAFEFYVTSNYNPFSPTSLPTQPHRYVCLSFPVISIFSPEWIIFDQTLTFSSENEIKSECVWNWPSGPLLASIKSTITVVSDWEHMSFGKISMEHCMHKIRKWVTRLYNLHLQWG